MSSSGESTRCKEARKTLSYFRVAIFVVILRKETRLMSDGGAFGPMSGTITLLCFSIVSIILVGSSKFTDLNNDIHSIPRIRQEPVGMRWYRTGRMVVPVLVGIVIVFSGISRVVPSPKVASIVLPVAVRS